MFIILCEGLGMGAGILLGVGTTYWRGAVVRAHYVSEGAGGQLYLSLGSQRGPETQRKGPRSQRRGPKISWALTFSSLSPQRAHKVWL